MNKTALTLAIVTTVAIATTLALAAGASAHVPSHTAGCDGITVSGTKYTQGGSVDLAIGTAHHHYVVAGPTFSYSLTNPDRTVAEPWTIVIDSNAGDGDATYEGTIQPCANPSTSVVASTTSTTPASTLPTTSSTSSTPSTAASTTTTAAPATTVSSGSTSPTPTTTTTSPGGSASTAPPASATSSPTSTPDAAAPPVRRPTASTLPETL